MPRSDVPVPKVPNADAFGEGVPKPLPLVPVVLAARAAKPLLDVKGPATEAATPEPKTLVLPEPKIGLGGSVGFSGVDPKAEAVDPNESPQLGAAVEAL